jgi:hypothetical protein
MKENIKSIENLNSVLVKLLNILNKLHYSDQAGFIIQLLDNLDLDDKKDFIKKINDVELWGGSGSIWELEIPDSFEARNFSQILIQLLNEMQNEGILSKRAESIQKLLAADSGHMRK